MSSTILSTDGYLGVSTSSQNAISILLQSPIVPASSPHKLPTIRDITPVALTNIKSVDTAQFASYISQVGPLYEQLQQIKNSEEEARTRRKGKSDKFAEGNKVSPNADGQLQFTLKGEYRRGYCSLPLLSTVPDVYFNKDFRLENPRTFDIVSERSDVVPPISTQKAINGQAPALGKSLATNAILQEKLSWYIDTVEMHLIDSISLASSSFLMALKSLRELHLEAAESVGKMQTLRQVLASFNKDVVMKGLEILQKQHKSYNLQLMNNAVLQLKFIVDGVAYCESLVENREVENALTEIHALELLVAGERDQTLGNKTSTNIPLRDMREVVALQWVPRDLKILRFQIGKIFESKLHSLLKGDLQRHVQSVSTEDVLLRWEAASIRAKGNHTRELSACPAYVSVADELHTALLPIIAGLHQSMSISTAIQSYRELVLQEVRNIVRKSLPSSTNDSGSTMSNAGSSVLARNIRVLDAEEAETLLSTIYIGIAETLRRLKTQSGLLLDNASAFDIQEDIHAVLDLPELLGQAVDISHERINKLLLVRSEQVKGLPLARFLRYFTLNHFFANECEAISGRAGTSLKTVVDGHIQDFIKAHRDREIQNLAQGTSTDNWQGTVFTAKDNEILKQILECSTSDPPAWTKTSTIWTPLLQEEVKEADGIKVSKICKTAKVEVQVVATTEETFLLPHSAILCLKGISHFLHLMGSIPSMTPDIATSLVSYLQIFDSRCRQLVLGAGAIRSAGLKNITTKHLALTSRALSFIANLIPHICEFVKRHVPAGPLSLIHIGEFHKVRYAFEEHQESIHRKIVEVMESRLRILSKTALETKWVNENAEKVRKYMVDLVLDTSRLYKVISKYLPKRTVELIMTPLFTSYKEQLAKVFKEVDLKTETGRNCMLCDVDYLATELGNVKEFGNLGPYLVKIIKDKEIKIVLPEP